MTIAVYPGTFDPVTNGHMDIARRAAALFDKLIIAVYDTPPKHLLYTTEERVALFRESVKSIKNIEVLPYKGLTIDYARQAGAKVIIRGLRMSSDFEREFEMALMNKKLAPELELFCLMSSLDYQFLSSSLLKEVAQLGGDIDNLVPACVARALKKKLALK